MAFFKLTNSERLVIHSVCLIYYILGYDTVYFSRLKVLRKVCKEELREMFQREYKLGGNAAHAYRNVINDWGKKATSQSSINTISLRQVRHDKSSRRQGPRVTCVLHNNFDKEMWMRIFDSPLEKLTNNSVHQCVFCINIINF